MKLDPKGKNLQKVELTICSQKDICTFVSLVKSINFKYINEQVIWYNIH